MSDEYTHRPNGNTQIEQQDAVEATNACGATLNRRDTMMKVYQSGKGRTTNSRGN